MSEEWKRPEDIAAVFGVSVRRVQQLVQEGIIKSEKIPGHAGRMFDLLPTITDYIKYLSDKAYGKSRSDKELALKEKKLKAEIALKESQGELHRLKTEIASGKVYFRRGSPAGLPAVLRAAEEVRACDPESCRRHDRRLCRPCYRARRGKGSLQRGEHHAECLCRCR